MIYDQVVNERAVYSAIVVLSPGQDSLRLSGTDEVSGDETIATSYQTILKFDVQLPELCSNTSEDELLWEFYPFKRPRSHLPKKNRQQPT